MKNKLKSLAKNVLIPLGLTAPVSTSDVEMHKKFLDWGQQH